MAKKKLSTSQQWMLDHPDDTPCPRGPLAAQAWRRKRGLERDPAAEVRQAKHADWLRRYEEALAAKRAVLTQATS